MIGSIESSNLGAATMQESVQEKAPERPAQAGQLKVSTGGAEAPFVDNRPSSAAQLKLAQMAQTAPKVLAQRRQMNVIHGGIAQLEEDDEPLQGKMEPAQRAVVDGVEVPDQPEAAQHPVQHPQAPVEAAPPEQAAHPVVGEQNPEMAPEQAAAEQAMVEQGEVPGTVAPGAPPLQDPNGQQDPNADAAPALPEQVMGNPPNAEAPGAEQHPLQQPTEMPMQHPVQNPAPPEEEAVPVQQKADPAQLAASEGAATGVAQLAFVRTWGDEEPTQAPARAPAAQQGAQPAFAPQMGYSPSVAISMQQGMAPQQAPQPQPQQEKLGFFGRIKRGIKNAAGRMGQWLMNWSGRGRQPQQAPSTNSTNINIFNGYGGGGVGGQQPAPHTTANQQPAGPKVYVKNEKRVGARRIQSRAPIARGADAAEQQRMMMERMKNSAEPTPAPVAAPAASPSAAPAAANGGASPAAGA